MVREPRAESDAASERGRSWGSMSCKRTSMSAGLAGASFYLSIIFSPHTVRMEIRTITPNAYPAQLREIPHVPEQLWVRGTLAPPKNKLLAVVGSRALTPYG